jgi:hypothetical protein
MLLQMLTSIGMITMTRTYQRKFISLFKENKNLEKGKIYHSNLINCGNIAWVRILFCFWIRIFNSDPEWIVTRC